MEIIGYSADRFNTCTSLEFGRDEILLLSEACITILRNLNFPNDKISGRKVSSKDIEDWYYAIAHSIMDWNYLSRAHTFDDDFITLFADKLDWRYLSLYQPLSDDIVKKFHNRISWPDLQANHYFDDARFSKLYNADKGISMEDQKTLEEQLAAVRQDGWAIEHVKNPSEAVQLAAVQQKGYAIQHIKNPSEAVQLAAVLQNGEAIQSIDNPSEAVQLAAVQQNGFAIEYVKNPSEAVQLAAVKQTGFAIYNIKNPSEAVQLAAVKQIGGTVRWIDNPSEVVQLAAVQQTGFAIQYIKNPSEAVQLAAVLQNGIAIQHIKNPSEAVQLAAGIKISNKPQSTENIVMNSLVLNTIKTDSIKAGYRIASTQLTNVVRNSVINILRNQDIAESQLSAVHSFLSSEAGSSFVQYLLGLSLQYAPKIKDNVHIACVSRELRVEGITGAGSFLTSTLFSSLMPILSSIPEMRIEELEEEQVSEVDILAAETETIAQATGG